MVIRFDCRLKRLYFCYALLPASQPVLLNLLMGRGVAEAYTTQVGRVANLAEYRYVTDILALFVSSFEQGLLCRLAADAILLR